jgi:NAD(P)-dependent dehydrogenase (short-subunit alcohol dehydrogenase family)
MARLIHFLMQAWTPPADPTTSFSGKTIVITGANTELGFEAALKIYALGAECVVMGVRDIAKREAAKAEMEKRLKGGERAGRDGAVWKVEVWKCDMDDYSSILQFVEKVNALEKLDCLVLNAGIFGVSYKVGNYSWEEVLQVNVL